MKVDARGHSGNDVMADAVLQAGSSSDFWLAGGLYLSHEVAKDRWLAMSRKFFEPNSSSEALT
jgi:hypothetical protein